MAFEKIPGIPGRCYRPEGCGRRKHPCGDCFCCQFCRDERCALCRREAGKGKDRAGDVEGGRGDRPPEGH
ncbi:MAG: hypothetical protein WHT06_15445 [Desulfobacterales bacterium]